MAFNTSVRAPQLNKASPFYKVSPLRSRSPTRNEASLSLRQVIGTTTTSNSSFSGLSNGSAFALAAGSGAILYELSEEFQISQRFFHAKPAAGPSATASSIHESPTPISSQNGARQRMAASLRESGYGVAGAGSPIGDNPDSPTKGPAGRTKAVTCLALSPDGRMLALGETGHRPRVLLFSTSKQATSDAAQSAVFEHTFGVRCLAFSPDSQYLASLGDMNDGFLHIWQLHRTGAVTLYASNKCTSNIRQISWMGNSLITCGTRHVKIWRLEENPRSPGKRVSDANVAFASPFSRTLLGRPCLRGPLLDRVFAAVAVISRTRAIVCSDVGDICLLDDVEPSPSFVKIADAGFVVTAATAQLSGTVLIAGSDGELKVIDMGENRDSWAHGIGPTLSEARTGIAVTPQNSVVALGFLSNALVMIDSAKGLSVLGYGGPWKQGLDFRSRISLPGHSGAVLGIVAIADAPNLAAFATWSADGSIKFWNTKGVCTNSTRVVLEQLGKDSEDYANELKTMNVFAQGKYLISGDKFGVMRICDIETERVLYETKAHGNEITAIAVFHSEHDTIIATAGRDRAVQLFRWQRGGCEHLQTIEEHSGAVTNVLFSENGLKLITASSDRTIVIMDAVPLDQSERIAGFIAQRPITLRSSPCSVQLVGGVGGMILVSTMDRHIQKFDLASGSLKTSFKTADQDGGDAVILNSAIQVPMSGRSSVIAGVSSSDKSIRVYDETGRLLEREYGHTEGMTGITLLGGVEGSSAKRLVTVASDGTIFVWDILSSGQQVHELFASMSMSPTEADRPLNLLATRPPLRRVLSSSELTRLQYVKEEGSGAPSLIPTIDERPILRRKASKLSMVQTPKLEPPIGRRSTTQSPSTTALESMQKRRASTIRPLSPLSGKQGAQTVRASSQAPSVGLGHNRRRSKSAAASPGGPNALTASTQAICRSLHLFRKKLTASEDLLALDNVRELEKELSLTAKVLAERSARNDTVMSKLLDQYSERLVGMLDEKIEASVARQMRTRVRSEDSESDTNDSGNNNNGYGADESNER